MHADRYVTQADDLRFGKAGHRLGDDAGRVGEVDDPGVRRQLFHPTGDIQHHRNGAQRLGEAADAGGLLAEQLVFQAQPFIGGARRQLPDAELGQHESGAVNGVVQREVHADLHLFQPVARQHAAGQGGDGFHFLAAWLDVHQRQFGDRQLIDALDQPIDQFGSVAAATANHRDFERVHERPSVCD